MTKIIKIENPEVLKIKNPHWAECVSLWVEFQDGIQMHVLKTIPEYHFLVFKNELIEKGYKEQDIDKLEDLIRDNVQQEQMASESD